jgi:hypothetical protein
VGSILRSLSNLQDTLQDFKRQIVSVGSIGVIAVFPARLADGPYDVQIAPSGRFNIFGVGPPLEGFLIVSPGRSPVLGVATDPPEVAQRLLDLCPKGVGLALFADQVLQLTASLFQLGGVVGLGCRLCPPQGVCQPEPDPAGFGCGEVQLPGLPIQIMCPLVRCFGVKLLSLCLHLLVG